VKVRFVAGAGDADRRAVVARLNALDVACRDDAAGVSADAVLDDEDALEIAKMPGVCAVATGAGARRERALAWLGGAAATIGVMAIVAANVPSRLGASPDPARAIDGVRPPWPLLPWFAATEIVPDWVPTRLLLVLAAAALFAWPTIGRRLAERRPWLHAALGAAALALVAGLAAWEIGR